MTSQSIVESAAQVHASGAPPGTGEHTGVRDLCRSRHAAHQGAGWQPSALPQGEGATRGYVLTDIAPLFPLVTPEVGLVSDTTAAGELARGDMLVDQGW